MITLDQLQQILRNASTDKLKACILPLNEAMAEFQIGASPIRMAAFIAQLAHESGEFRWFEEIWGPTTQQKKYEPPSSLARQLGNTTVGDGFRFKGRGPLQITGRANYKRYGDVLKVDLVTHPELAAAPALGLRIAGAFWERNGLNTLADAGNFTDITQRINGGQNGAADRERYYALAKLVLGAGTTEVSAKAEVAVRKKKKPESASMPTFPRGAEAVQAQRSAPAQRVDPLPDPTLDARRDTLDFRDLMYTPTLIEVPTHVPLGDYLDVKVPILNQGKEGACTGFGLATVVNYLMLRRRVLPDKVPVSAQMLYQMARRYDEWPGEDYSGSSARGAMKGWHKHGVCKSAAWTTGDPHPTLSHERQLDALKRPLGAYFRVNHTDLVAMHSAIAEVGVLYATAAVHTGWFNVGPDGIITQAADLRGGHAFAIVAYDDKGFWLQNSWGEVWGSGGFGHLSYDDWLANGTDVWVARLGAPVVLNSPASTSTASSGTSGQSAAYAYSDLRPHVISVGNNGVLKPGGDYGSTPAELAAIFTSDIPRVIGAWKKPKLLLYAHGGLVSETAAVQRLAEYRSALLAGEVYPMAFIWRSDYWTTLTNILSDAVRRKKPEGMLDSLKDFMLDRLDDALEPVARALTGRASWDEMKQNALGASSPSGAATLVADQIKALTALHPDLQIHLVGHSAGSILHGPFVGLLQERNVHIETCTLWAPACTVALFNQYYVPAMKSRAIGKLTVFGLRDAAERDDNCARIYNKSLLYLVSDAFEDRFRIPNLPGRPDYRPGEAILGMEKFFVGDLAATFQACGAEFIFAPNNESAESLRASDATHHGDFDDDINTVKSTFGRITGASAVSGSTVRTFSAAAGAGAAAVPAMPKFKRSDSSLRDRRRGIDAKIG